MISLHAQNDYKAMLNTILKHSQSDFSKIIGSLREDDSNDDDDAGSQKYAIYKSKFKMGIGEDYIAKILDFCQKTKSG